MTIETHNSIFNCFHWNRHKDGSTVNDWDIELTDFQENETPESLQKFADYLDALQEEAKERAQKNADAVAATWALAKENLKKTAQTLNEEKIIYLIFGALDGANLSYSTLKYVMGMDAQSKNSNVNMHEWLSSDAGITSAVLLYPTLFFYSALGTYWDDKDKNAYKAFVAKSWPYIRDILKASKNALTGPDNVLKALTSNDLISSVSIRPHMVFPIALALGVLSILNRILYRCMLSGRKDMMSGNSGLLENIRLEKWLTRKQTRQFRRRIGRQSLELRAAAIASAAYAGTVQSLYLYFGVFSLFAFTSPWFFVVLSCALLYSTVNIFCQIYEEYDFQQQLVITGAQIEFELFQKEHLLELEIITTQIQNFLLVNYDSLLDEKISMQLGLLLNKRDGIVSNFIQVHKKYQDALRVTRLGAVLGGLKNGLSAQNTVFGIMFAVTSMAAVFAAATCPPAFFVACSLMGLLFLSGFLTESWKRNTQHQKALKTAHQAFCKRITSESIALLETDLKNLNDAKLRPPFHDFFEIIRTFFSGLAKGIRSIEFAFNYNKDSPKMLIIMYLASIFHAFVFALRNFARGFGRAPLFNPEAKKAGIEEGSKLEPEPVSVGEFGQDPEPRPDSQIVNPASTSLPIPLETPAKNYILPPDAFSYSPAFFKDVSSPQVNEVANSNLGIHCTPQFP